MKFLRRLIPYVFVALAIVLVFPLIYGCSGDDSSNRFHRLLGMIPVDIDAPENFIIINDYASAFEDVGISLEELDEQSVSFQGFTDMIREKEIRVDRIKLIMPSDITGWGTGAGQELIQDKNVGYSYASVDAEMATGIPPNEVVVAIGRYDPQATLDALSHQDEWPLWAVEAYTVEDYRGVTIHSWGDGCKIHMETRYCPPHIDKLGRARPLAVTDDRLFYAASVEVIKLMINASLGKTQSLADLPRYAEIADGLYDLNCCTAFIANESMVLVNPLLQYPDYSDTGPQLKYFVTFGSGAGKDDKGSYMALVIYHDNREDAESNVSLLERRIAETSMVSREVPWSDVFIDIEIWAKGNVLFAKLYTDIPTIYTDLIYAREPLLLHES